MDSATTDMQPSLDDGSPMRRRRAWEAPTIVRLPIDTQTRSPGATAHATDFGSQESPPPPAAPATKLGFAFEMSFPLSVRTE